MFLIRRGEDDVFNLPRRPELAAALDEEECHGEWFLVMADYPNEAFAHARNSVLPDTPCRNDGPCQVCAAATVARAGLPEHRSPVRRGGREPPMLAGDAAQSTAG